MSYSLVHDKKRDVIRLTITGRFDATELRRIAPEVARLTHETGCRRILNDIRKADVRFSFMEVFHSPNMMDTAGIGRETRRALVVPRDFNEAGFLEDVTRNRGHRFRVFQTCGQALRWLQKD